MLFASGRAFYRAYQNSPSPLRQTITLSRRDGNCITSHGLIKRLERVLEDLHEHSSAPKATMSYFLVRYLYRKYKNRNHGPEPDLNEYQEQQVLNFADQRPTSSGADGDKGHAPLREKQGGTRGCRNSWNTKRKPHQNSLL
jgi:hypothetical protein